MPNPHSQFCDGITRRSVVQCGLGGLFGLALPDLLRLQAQSAEPNAKKRDTAIIYLEMAGGPSQFETYDPKPEAPHEYRGPYQTIDTALPGVQFCEVMPQQAKIADQLVVLRAIHHDSASHSTSAHFTQTGYYLTNRLNRDNEMPCIGAYTSRLRGANAEGVPAFVSIPTLMRYGGAGWLGKGFNPFITLRDADDPRFSVPNLTLLRGLSTDRLENRRELLAGFDVARRTVDNDGVADAMDQFTHEAFRMVTGDAARKAFDISAEDPKTRDRYGRNRVGQNILLARRLVEHGVTIVTVRDNRLGSWDDHRDLVGRMNAKGPAHDQGVAALVQDLQQRGLDKKVMVVGMGEFGRTPRMNKTAGRDHWGRVMSVVMAGGGLPVGQVIGSSDAHGSEPVDRPYRPENILSVMYRHLGIDTSLTFNDTSGRPRYILERREPVDELA